MGAASRIALLSQRNITGQEPSVLPVLPEHLGRRAFQGLWERQGPLVPQALPVHQGLQRGCREASRHIERTSLQPIRFRHRIRRRFSSPRLLQV